MYGTSPLIRAWIERRRARVEDGERAVRRLALAEVRRERGLTQREAARRAGMSQSDLSKLERRGDVRLSTLRHFARALGGRVQVIFTRQGVTCELKVGDVRTRG